MTTIPFTSYAQNMEDIRLWRALRHVTPGRYIDIGAWDPRIDSVSRGFYEKGWRGCHFEPHPIYAQRLRDDRPDEEVYQIALSDHEGSMSFYLVGEDGTSSGDRDLAVAAAGTTGKLQEINVPITTLGSHFAPNKDSLVHWMKIDVEGMEAQVLQGWNSDILRPWVIVIEATRPMSRIQTHHTFEHLLIAADYLPAGFDGLNRYYVANEHKELVDLVSEPVSILDLLDDCCLSDTSTFVLWRRSLRSPVESDWVSRIYKQLRDLKSSFRRK